METYRLVKVERAGDVSCVRLLRTRRDGAVVVPSDISAPLA